MSKLTPPVNSKDHIQGKANGLIELVEYGDYECPHCGRAYPIIKRIQKKIGPALKFIFRNFPLAEIHPHATKAAVAAEAASGQGFFWQMHDMIFENQDRLEDEDLLTYAAKIGMNRKKFITDFENKKYLEKVEADFESGIRSGVNGTPSFFINGEKYNGDWDEMPLFRYLQMLIE